MECLIYINQYDYVLLGIKDANPIIECISNVISSRGGSIKRLQWIPFQYICIVLVKMRLRIIVSPKCLYAFLAFSIFRWSETNLHWMAPCLPLFHEDIMARTSFPHHWPFVRGMHCYKVRSNEQMIELPSIWDAMMPILHPDVNAPRMVET